MHIWVFNWIDYNVFDKFVLPTVVKILFFLSSEWSKPVTKNFSIKIGGLPDVPKKFPGKESTDVGGMISGSWRFGKKRSLV